MKLKKYVSILVLANAVSSFTFADVLCEENEFSGIALHFDVSGAAEVKRGTTPEKTVIEKFFPGSQDYSDLERWSRLDKVELLSPVFVIEDAESFAIALNKAKCQIVLYVVDSESISQAKILSLTTSSIEYENEDLRHKISKIKND